MNMWSSALELDSQREIRGGSPQALAEAIRAGADLRIATGFVHNEHIDVNSPLAEPIREVAEFGVTYLLDDRWSAGIMSLRQPIELPVGFGPRPSMSFFLYNQDGLQGIARPHLDGRPVLGSPGPSPNETPERMPKYHVIDSWDAGTRAPSHNFIYDFSVFRYCVDRSWKELLAHDETGAVVSGSLEELVAAFDAGCAIKLGIRNLCDSLQAPGKPALSHDLFVQAGSSYYYTERRQLMTGTHPLVRVRPAIPLRYETGNWDFGWIMARTDGHVVYRRCDPYTLRFTDHPMRCAIRWFVR
jgi:hypothetical protein